MISRFKTHPYLLGLGIGAVMIVVFVSGTYLFARGFYFIGALLTGLGLLTWPSFAGLALFMQRKDTHSKIYNKTLWMIPLGAILIVAGVNLLLTIK